MNYLVNEIFSSMQGEASYTGTPSVFIRLQGCPVGCGWCDTKHTWDVEEKNAIPIIVMVDKDEDAPTYSIMNEYNILDTLKDFAGWHVVITGGEPCIYDLIPLTNLLIEKGYSVQIETSGTYDIKCHPETFVTVSPKINMPGGLLVLKQSILNADEIKLPVGKKSDVDKLLALFEEFKLDVTKINNIWLQPLSQSEKATDICIELANEYGWRVSIQTHKFLGLR